MPRVPTWNASPLWRCNPPSAVRSIWDAARDTPASRSRGAEPAQVQRWKLRMEFDDWVARTGTSPPRVTALEAVFDELPSEARRYFAVGARRSFAIDAAWFEVRRDARAP